MNIIDLLNATENFKAQYARPGILIGVSFEHIAVRLADELLGKDIPMEFEGFRVIKTVLGDRVYICPRCQLTNCPAAKDWHNACSKD